jgi:hypothetical protein
MTTAMDNWPAAARFVAIAATGQLPTAPSYTTPWDTTPPVAQIKDKFQLLWRWNQTFTQQRLPEAQRSLREFLQ